MSSAIRKNTEQISLVIPSSRACADTLLARNKIRSLQKKIMEIQRELDSLDQVPTPEVEEGLDFYTEVSRFQIEMISRALKAVEGHQRKAARLLNLDETTLNAMIKRYHIPLEPLPDTRAQQDR